MKIKKNVVIREIAGETMLIPVGDTTGEYNGIFTLSPTAATAFEALQNGGDENDALKAVLSEYEVDEETAKKDLEEFMALLREFGIV